MGTRPNRDPSNFLANLEDAQTDEGLAVALRRGVDALLESQNKTRGLLAIAQMINLGERKNTGFGRSIPDYTSALNVLQSAEVVVEKLRDFLIKLRREDVQNYEEAVEKIGNIFDFSKAKGINC